MYSSNNIKPAVALACAVVHKLNKDIGKVEDKGLDSETIKRLTNMYMVRDTIETVAYLLSKCNEETSINVITELINTLKSVHTHIKYVSSKITLDGVGSLINTLQGVQLYEVTIMGSNLYDTLTCTLYVTLHNNYTVKELVDIINEGNQLAHIAPSGYDLETLTELYGAVEHIKRSGNTLTILIEAI